MDPITLIVTALITGAAAALHETAAEEVKKAYSSLKALVQRRFAGKAAAELALTKTEQKPDVWREPLKDALSETSADKDEEILKAAQALMVLLRPQQAAQGKFNVQIAGDVKGLAQGDHQRVQMNFGDRT